MILLCTLMKLKTDQIYMLRLVNRNWWTATLILPLSYCRSKALKSNVMCIH